MTATSPPAPAGTPPGRRPRRQRPVVLQPPRYVPLDPDGEQAAIQALARLLATARQRRTEGTTST